MNRMTVSHMWLSNKIVEVNITDQSNMHSALNRAFEDDMTQPFTNKNNTAFDANNSFDWSKLVRCAMLCNRSVFKDDAENMAKEPWKRSCTGDASEQAIYQYTEVAKGKVIEYRAANKKILEIPFNSTNKFQVSIHETVENKDQGLLLVMKGAPERMLERSSHILVNGETLELTKEWVASFNEAYEALGGMGERVLGFCDFRLDPKVYNSEYKFDVENINFPVKNLRFLGFYSLIDPPKPSVPEAVAKCKTAGISVFMVTGDHPITAKAIAQSVGIITQETKEDIAKRLRIPVEQVNPRDAKACVIHGSSLINMSAEELDSIIRNHKEIVFARTSPQQKLIIVEACQTTKQLVGVTGDGVNDSPAMKKADIGISMGITGSDVSKQVADMVLLDDNFATIVSGIEEGRLIFDNIGKIVCYTFTKNLAELCPFIFYVLTDCPIALTTITMLCVDLGTDILPSISLSYEKAEKGIMEKPPRDPVKDKMTNAKVILPIK
jgi:sodium/potassium-transporting ATPase subunit alpha